MIVRVLAVLILMVGGNLWSSVRAGSIYPEEFAKDFGNLPVGFRVDDLTDHSRTYSFSTADKTDTKSKPDGRLVRVYTWYPGKANEQAQPMTFGRYIEISRQDLNTGEDSIIIPDDLPIERVRSDDEMEGLSILTTKAFENAPPMNNRYPVIVFGQGLYYENPISHFALCEYLASHGYVVVSCPLLGTNSPMVMLTVRDLETIVRDLEFIMADAIGRPYVDAEKIGIIGFDMGGMAAQILQMRNTGIDAIMTIDAGIIFTHYSGLPASHPSFDPQRVTVPWMHMTQDIFVNPYRQYLGQSIWGIAPDERYLLLFSNSQHVNFTSYGLLDIPKPLMTYWGENILPNIPLYSELCKTGLAFLNVYLKDSRNDRQILVEEAENNDRDKIYTLERIEGTVPPPNIDEFLNGIIKGEIDKTIEQIRKYKEIDSSWAFYPENSVNDIGYRFLYSHNMAQIALKIFKLNVDMYPQSGNAYDSYAEALLALDRIDEAIENYEKSLELNPDNQNAKKVLDDLKNQ